MRCIGIDSLRAIREGEVYQINYTLPFDFPFAGEAERAHAGARQAPAAGLSFSAARAER